MLDNVRSKKEEEEKKTDTDANASGLHDGASTQTVQYYPLDKPSSNVERAICFIMDE